MSGFVTSNGLTLALGVGVVLLVAFVVTDDAAVTRRVFQRFFLNIALPVVMLLGLPVIWLATAVETPVLQALIAGLVIAAGWLTTAIFAELERVRSKEEKTRDYHKALFAEIQHTLDAFYADGRADADTGDIIRRMRADDSFVPFIPKEHHDRIYLALVDGIDVLPRQTIDAVVAYYSVISALQAFAEDMRGQGFRRSDQPRRIAMYEDYAAMRSRAFYMGEQALTLIKLFSEQGAGAAQAAAEAFSNRDAARPDQGRRSE